MKERFKKLSRELDYEFVDEQLFKTALTHRSVGSRHNERLEFLGDSVLNFVIAEKIYLLFPAASEGELSRMRASLVKEDTLAEIARGLSLGDYLFLGSGELKSGGYRRASILADALEAIIGSVYLDRGFEQAKALILRLYKSRIKSITPDECLKDPKSKLQEFLQSRRQALPEYRVTTVEGAAHAQEFRIECHISVLPEPAVGNGSSRRKAEQAAAKIALPLVKKVLNE